MQSSCASAFDIVFTNWRREKSASIRLAVAESIGLLTEVMSPKKFAAKFAEILVYFAGAPRASDRSSRR